MGGNEERSLERIYSVPYDFTQAVHDDVSALLNVKEFAAYHDIDGMRVPAVITDDTVNPAGSSYPEGIYLKRKVLYVSAGSIRAPSSGTVTRIDGQVYQVISGTEIQGELWRIELEVSEVR